MKSLLRVVASLLVVVSLHAAAEGDAAAGQAKSAVCAACHGADGNSMVPQWPSLAGQHPAYFVRQVTLIQASHRPVPEMTALVAGLGGQDIADLAAWFGSQQTRGGVADETLVEMGQRIWRAGNEKTGVPACAACHGPVGEGNPLALYPALAGQHSAYTTSLLKRYRGGENWGPKDLPSQAMNGVAAALTDHEIDAVSSYIQGLHRAGN